MKVAGRSASGTLSLFHSFTRSLRHSVTSRALRAPAVLCYFQSVNTLQEIEAAIEQLPVPQIEELAQWLEGCRRRHAATPSAEEWLQQARGAAQAGVSTDAVMALTRGES